MMRPRVSVNMAMTLDGKIATKAYTPARFTSAKDGQRLLELRAGADALLVGRGTLEADSMRMTVPSDLLGNRLGPKRCVISYSGRWNAQHPLFQSEGPQVILYSAEGNGVGSAEAEAVKVNSVKDVMADLWTRGVRHLHCEGGGMLLYDLFSQDCVDQLFLTWAAGVAFGGGGAPTIAGKPAPFLTETRHFRLVEYELGEQEECYLHYQRVR